MRLLADFRAIECHVAARASLELRDAPFALIAALARAFLHHDLLRVFAIVNPRPYVCGHPCILCEPQVVVGVFKTILDAIARLEMGCKVLS